MSFVLPTARARVLAAALSGGAAFAAVAAVGVPSRPSSAPAASTAVSARADDALGHKEQVLVAAMERRIAEAPTPTEAEVTATAAAEPVESTEPAEPAEPARSVWDDLADCESGAWIPDGGFVRGSATWDSTAGFFEGGVQFHPDTWDAFRDADMPAAAYEASRADQIVVAERVLDAQGWRAWPVCSRKLGLR